MLLHCLSLESASLLALFALLDDAEQGEDTDNREDNFSPAAVLSAVMATMMTVLIFFSVLVVLLVLIIVCNSVTDGKLVGSWHGSGGNCWVLSVQDYWAVLNESLAGIFVECHSVVDGSLRVSSVVGVARALLSVFHAFSGFMRWGAWGRGTSVWAVTSMMFAVMLIVLHHMRRKVLTVSVGF